MADIFQENDKFVSSRTHNHIFRIKHPCQKPRQLHQHLISEKMPVPVIGLLKIIHINDHHPTGGIRVFIFKIFIDQLFAEKMIVQRSQ